MNLRRYGTLTMNLLLYLILSLLCYHKTYPPEDLDLLLNEALQKEVQLDTRHGMAGMKQTLSFPLPH
jgi:hypothetical protein